MHDFYADTLSKAGLELTKRFQSKLEISIKKDESIVTDADLASEKVIITEIQKFFPGDTIVSEEAGLSSEIRQPGSYIWIIDPLDGTTNFANSYPYFCISVGRAQFLEDGSISVISGAILDPIHQKFFFAEKGRGAFCNGESMHVATEREFSKAFLVTGFYYLKGEELKNAVSLFLSVASSCSAIRRDGAAALDLAMVAAGVFDGFWEYGLQIWDTAAGSLLVTEAKGVAENYYTRGHSYDIEKGGIIAGNALTVSSLQKIIA